MDKVILEFKTASVMIKEGKKDDRIIELYLGLARMTNNCRKVSQESQMLS